MCVGEASGRSGVHPKMIRHYEAIGRSWPERRRLTADRGPALDGRYG
jgi:DNA-binding transcriptional MerR regulator